MNRTFAKDHERKKLPSISSIIITIIIIFSVAFRFSHLSFLSIWIQFNVFGCMIYSPACVCVSVFFHFPYFSDEKIIFYSMANENWYTADRIGQCAPSVRYKTFAVNRTMGWCASRWMCCVFVCHKHVTIIYRADLNKCINGRRSIQYKMSTMRRYL